MRRRIRLRRIRFGVTAGVERPQVQQPVLDRFGFRAGETALGRRSDIADFAGLPHHRVFDRIAERLVEEGRSEKAEAIPRRLAQTDNPRRAVQNARNSPLHVERRKRDRHGHRRFHVHAWHPRAVGGVHGELHRLSGEACARGRRDPPRRGRRGTSCVEHLPRRNPALRPCSGKGAVCYKEHGVRRTGTPGFSHSRRANWRRNPGTPCRGTRSPPRRKAGRPPEDRRAGRSGGPARKAGFSARLGFSSPASRAPPNRACGAPS